MGVGSKTENDLARLVLQCVLANDAITAVIPGASTVYEAENAVMASYTRPFGQNAAEKAWMQKKDGQAMGRSPRGVPVAAKLGDRLRERGETHGADRKTAAYSTS